MLLSYIISSEGTYVICEEGSSSSSILYLSLVDGYLLKKNMSVYNNYSRVFVSVSLDQKTK